MDDSEVTEGAKGVVSVGVDGDIDVAEGAGSEVAVADSSQVGVIGVKSTGPYGSSSSSAWRAFNRRVFATGEDALSRTTASTSAERAIGPAEQVQTRTPKAAKRVNSILSLPEANNWK